MLNEREILTTLEMLKNEHLDVRTVTMGINLFDCASDDPQRFQNNIQRKITTLAAKLVAVCDEVGEKYTASVAAQEEISRLANAASSTYEEFKQINDALESLLVSRPTRYGC